LGAHVEYFAETRTALITSGSAIIFLKAGSAEAYVNGVKHILDVPVTVVRPGRMMVPLGFAGLALGVQTDWLAEENKVVITGRGAPGLSGQEAELLRLINEERAKYSLSPVTLAAPLRELAARHAEDMAAGGFLSHVSPEHGGLEARANALGLANLGENIAKGYPDAKSVLDGWLANETHRKNILAPEAVFVGVGIRQPEGGGADDIVYCLDWAYGGGFFVMDRAVTKTDGSTLQVFAYVAQAQTPLTMFLLDPLDSEKYLERREVYLSPGAVYACAVSVDLWAQGLYALYLGNDKLIIDNRP